MFVCHGNICRSPMAEFIFKDMLEKQGMAQNFVVASSATSTEEIWRGVGNPVYPPAKRELEKHGLCCDSKRAVQVTAADYDKYDYLIIMDDRNRRGLQWIIKDDPKQKIHMLLDFAGRPGQSIADPWYTGNFDITYDDVLEGCEGLLEYLLEHQM